MKQYEKPTAQLAVEALEMLRQRGWAHGTGEGPRGEVCLGVAINRTCGAWIADTAEPPPDLHPALIAAQKVSRLALEVISEQYPGTGYLGIPAWNDEPGRTFDDVERVLEKVIAEA